VAKKFPVELYRILACPCNDKPALTFLDSRLYCPACGASHAIVAGVPILINPAASLFDPKDFMEPPQPDSPRWGVNAKNAVVSAMSKLTPQIAANLNGRENVASLLSLLADVERPRILIVGGGEVGDGLGEALGDPRYEFVETDVYWGDRVNILADGHDLPFLSESFDAVVCQAVLEHVVDPWRCVQEMHRVLRPEGVIFVDLPFLWPVHMGAYDYTRFTLTGVRLLCRGFEELRAGVSAGPGQTLALATFQFFRSFSYSRLWSVFMLGVLPWFLFWMRHCDRFLNRLPQASDASCGLFFIGENGPPQCRTGR
jgi:SAM-dependent methyltransferase/uncharacterized protein YbaR (Trm112 family)